MRRFLLFLAILLPGLASPAWAADRDVPYWASIRAKQVNLRVGPARGYRVSWLYRRQHLPLKVLRLQEAWRMVEDQDGQRGWVLAQFLSPERTAVIVGRAPVEVREEPAGGRLLWHAEPGVIGKLGACEDGWCRFDMDGGHVGFVQQQRLWGASAP